MNLVIIGLGNPGRSYLETRHNAGFWVVDALAKQFQLKWTLHSSSLYMHIQHSEPHGQLHLIKPQTFMNSSGEALMPFFHHHNVEDSELLVVVDQMDLLPGCLRFRSKGGNAGHNGLKSIEFHLGTQDYSRLYFGIGRPVAEVSVVDYVLQPSLDGEKRFLEEGIEKATFAILEWWRGMSFERVMNAYNQR